MDSYEATKLVFSRIKAIDPENASKIMGYLFIQDNGDKEMIRLAFGPETLLHNLIFKAKTHLSNASASASSAATPSSLSLCSAPWLPASSPTNSSLSYANVVVNGTNAAAVSECYSNISNFNEFHNQLRVQDHLSFLEESEPAMSSPNADHNTTNYGLGCLYFTKGFCKNGTTCKFHHIHSPDSAAAIFGPPSKLNEFEQFQQELLLRSKASVLLQQRKLAADSKFINFLTIDTQRSAALMTNDFSGSMFSPSARQIYLTFPADSTFREEDVSNYFSLYGPVHDVRIPYQQKRMFGFVTFVYPETVKFILAKGNPHFVCDSRVLVKPYKEKGKFQEKKMEREEYSSACSSPSRPFDFHFGGRMLYDNRDSLRRKLEEQADLQQAIELQGRRLMNLRLHLKNNHQFHHGLSNGSPIPSPTLSHTPNNQTRIFSPEGADEEVPPEENGGNPVTDSKNADHQLQQEGNPTRNHYDNNNSDGDNKEEKTNTEENDIRDSFEHILPDNLFASPKKSAGGHITIFSSASTEANEKNTSSVASNNNNTKLPSMSPSNVQVLFWA